MEVCKNSDILSHNVRIGDLMAVVIEWEFLRLVEEQRQALRLTIEELAARADLSPRQYQNYLSGKMQPLFGTAMWLAAAVDIDLNALQKLLVPDLNGYYLKPSKAEKEKLRLALRK